MGRDKGPSPEEIARKQREAAKQEREAIALEQAQQEAFQEQELQEAYASKSKRREFAVQDDDMETNRKRFLRGV